MSDRPLRFLVVGGINTVVGIATFPALQWAFPPLVRHYMAALLIAQAVSLLFAYTTQKLLVFRTRGGGLAEFAKFCSFYLGIYALNWAALPLLVEVVGLKPWVAQVGFVVATVIGSWFFHSRLTFRSAPTSR
ncbi:GtrA family protein [Sphingomonas sp.]|jgi:putative flippase GtrA|uniref:GtrA family protein n=1 Tax=Sphingomonas sp. TaxID=28214 RepID=UPI002D801C88|nr:GtrA family protein [Sphingomonas sp.]HEU0044473.1 GtrA family protein [Sphingomonas sp.]